MPAAPRFYCAEPMHTCATLGLPAGAARHVQVLRLQPGDTITLFGSACGGEFDATITEMGRTAVQVVVGRHCPVERESAQRVHLAIGMPANERMDWLVEKATELGAASIQPLMSERSVVRLDEARARKKTAHWNAIAIAACEQCGRNRIPTVHMVSTLAAWGRMSFGAPAVAGSGAAQRLVLSLRPGTPLLRHSPAMAAQATQELLGPVTLLSGPEGGLSAAEEEWALRQGFAPVSLGARVYRAETAALAALTLLA